MPPTSPASPGGSGPQFVSLGTKTAVALSAVLAAAGVATAVELSNQTRAHLVEGKVTAAEMVVDLFAASVAPALDFDDDEALHQEVAKIGSNQDVVYAAVYRPGDRAPVAELSQSSESRSARPTSASTAVRPDRIDVTRILKSREGKDLGSLVVKLSLSRENERFASARLRIIEFTGIVTLLAAAFILAMARRVVTRPLRSLAHAARRLEQGSAEPVELGANDEIGQLGAAFNTMAHVIVDRERRLAELNHELQQLLDNMREAILVFTEGGVLLSVKSRQAGVIFDRTELEGLRIRDLLYPDAASDVGAEAFDEWVQVAFGVPKESWDAVAELSPTEVVLDGAGGERILSLDFRPIEIEGRIARIMLLASDETEKRLLERTVKVQGEEHEKQMAAMRRLLAGGGQLLVSVLGRARERLGACDELLARARGDVEAGLVEQLFQHVHSVKGEARAFDLSLLEAAAAELEDYLAIQRGRLRERRAPSVEDIRADLQRRITDTRDAVSRAAEMLVQASPIGAAILEQVTVQRSDVDRLQRTLGSRTDEVGRLVNRLASRPLGELLLGLAEAAPRWAARENKRARIEVEGREILVPPKVAEILPDVMTHLVRNALAHGIETTADRALAGKDEVGLIRVSATETPEGPEFLVEDDGRGIDVQAVSARAEALGLSPDDAARLVFVQGLSTANASSLAGHGVGLGAVEADLEAAGYGMTLQSGSTGVSVKMVPLRRSRPAPALRDVNHRTGST